MRVLLVSSEVYPLIKTGGLADVIGALPSALLRQEVEVRLLVPAYPAAVAALGEVAAVHELGDVLDAGPTRLIEGWMPDSGAPVWLVDNPRLYDRPGGPYQQPDGAGYPDNFRRFAVLSKVAAMIADGGAVAGYSADIVHANDWQTGLVASYLKAAKPQSTVKSLFTIHNLHFQGNFSPSIMTSLGLPAALFTPEGLEFFGQVSYLKAGIYYADHVTTVSPTYAWEITTPEGGRGLDGLLSHRARAGQLTGILNGVDYNLWDPRHDGNVPMAYGPNTVEEGKAACKQALRAELGLAAEAPGPLFAVVSRLSDQKGIDLVLAGADSVLSGGGQWVILGSGDDWLEQAARALTARYPGQVATIIGYDEELSHRIQAAADVFVVPSRFEPCGLTQLYALRYGALPLVRHTGGLADTVTDISDDYHATGFVFGQALEGDFRAACHRALDLWYHDRPRWNAARRRAMRQDFGWDRAAIAYAALYRRLVS